MSDSSNPEKKNKVLLVMISNKKSCIYFHYKKDFVQKLSESKKKYGLFWSAENKRWEFDTEKTEEIHDFLQEQLFADVMIEDLRVDHPMESENTPPKKTKLLDQPDTPHPKKKKRPLFERQIGINYDC